MSSLKERIELLENDLKAVPQRISVYHDLPFAILRYDPEEEWTLRREVRLLATRLEEAGRDIRPSVLVNRLDPLGSEALFLIYALATSRAVKDNIRLYLESLQHVRPRLRGSSLEELGLQPGPLYGEIMKELRRAVLDGELRSAEEVLDFIVSYLELQKEG